MIRWYHSRILRKIIKFGFWNVAIRACSRNYLYEKESDCTCFTRIPNTEKYWFADPVLFQEDGKTWLFVEAYNNLQHKGEIGVFDIVKGRAQNFRIVIQEKFHMSFPLVFKMNGVKYMIPETGDNNKITLYTEVQFPDKWKIEKDLLEGDKYRDTTVYTIGNDIYLYTYVRTDNSRFFHTYKCMLYMLDRDTHTLHFIEEYDDVSVNRRSAGPVIYHDNKLVHVTQKCDKCYGEAIEFWQTANDQTSWKKNSPYKIVLGKDVAIDDLGNPLILHTYSRTSDYEAIDYRLRKR